MVVSDEDLYRNHFGESGESTEMQRVEVIRPPKRALENSLEVSHPHGYILHSQKTSGLDWYVVLALLFATISFSLSVYTIIEVKNLRESNSDLEIQMAVLKNKLSDESSQNVELEETVASTDLPTHFPTHSHDSTITYLQEDIEELDARLNILTSNITLDVFHWQKDLDVINETLNKLTQEFKILKNESEENRALIESLIFQVSDGTKSDFLTSSTTTLPLVPDLYAFEFCGGVTSENGWQNYIDQGIRRTIDISGCGFQNYDPIVVVSNLIGETSHWNSRGGSEPYHISSENFDIYIYDSVSPDAAAQYEWKISWFALPPRTASDICSGYTPTSGWNSASPGLNRIIRFSSCGFIEPPVVVSALAGRTDSWTTTGGSEPYTISQSSFEIFVNIQGSMLNEITPSSAQDNGWHIHWVAAMSGVYIDRYETYSCAGKTENSDWIVHSAYDLLLNVDISHCGFTSAPILVTSLSGTSSMWVTTGGSEPYHVSASSFAIFIHHAVAITPERATENDWHINWIARKSS